MANRREKVEAVADFIFLNMKTLFFLTYGVNTSINLTLEHKFKIQKETFSYELNTFLVQLELNH